MTQSDDKRDNVVDIRQLRKAKRAGASGGNQKNQKKQPSKVWVGLQLAVFLALVAYLMQTCT